MRMRALLLCAPLVLAAGCATSSDARSVVIRNVTVIDGTGRPAEKAMTVIVEGTRITTVAPAATTSIPRHARVIDGSGKYLIPGLWDMHTHLSSWGADVLPTLVRYGVLTVRDLGGRLNELDQWRDTIERGARIGPRIYRAGPFIDGPKEMSPERASMTVVVRTAEEARAAVRDLKSRGVDLIKTHNGLSRDAFLAVAGECRAQGLPLAVHLASRSLTIEEASDAGVSSLEHIEMLTESIVFSSLPPGEKPKDAALAALGKLTDERATETFRRFVKNGTWYDPNLVAYRSFMQEAIDLAPTKPDYREAAAGRTTMFNRFVQLVGLMHRIGVPLMTGTDFGPRPEKVPYPVVHPGTELHDELLLFVKAGLTTIEALQAATSAPARFMRLADRLGTVTPGKEADLLLLDRDPLADIANTRAIDAVVLRGKVLDRKELEALKAAEK